MFPHRTIFFSFLALCHVNGWIITIKKAASGRTIRFITTTAKTNELLSTKILRMVPLGTKEKEATTTKEPREGEVPLSPEEATEKYGLEVGLLQSMADSSSGGANAASLLKKYGIAYLATSIPLAIVSFAVCYILVDTGIDVESLLHRLPGFQEIDLSNGGAKAGTVAIAYAAHKAISPLRFPPTVILTPMVAKFLGKDPSTQNGGEVEK